MKRSLLMMIVLAVLGLVVFGQEPECQPVPCTSKSAGRLRLEMANCMNTLDIYVYDNGTVPLRGKRITGHAEFYYRDGGRVDAEFRQFHTTNRLTARIRQGGFSSCRVVLMIDGTEISAVFENMCGLSASKRGKENPSR